MIWKLRPALAVFLFVLYGTVAIALASFLSEFIKRGTWSEAFSAWIYRKWEPWVISIGIVTLTGLAIWWLQRRFSGN